jgi:hypothetical protein
MDANVNAVFLMHRGLPSTFASKLRSCTFP